MHDDPSLFVIPADFWERRHVVDALHERDMGALFRLVTKYTGASESGIGMRVGMSQPEVSDIVRGKRRVTHQHVLERIADGMDAPDRARHSLGLAARADEPVHRAVDEPGAPGTPLAVRSASDQITTATGSGRRTTTELHNALRAPNRILSLCWLL